MACYRALGVGDTYGVVPKSISPPCCPVKSKPRILPRIDIRRGWLVSAIQL